MFSVSVVSIHSYILKDLCYDKYFGTKILSRLSMNIVISTCADNDFQCHKNGHAYNIIGSKEHLVYVL